MSERLAALARAFLEAHPTDAARRLERAGPEERAAALEDSPGIVAARVLEQMTAGAAAECVAEAEPPRAAALVAAMRRDAGASVLRRLPAEARDRVVPALPPDAQRELRDLLVYEPNSAGALMDPDILTLPADIAAGEGIERVRASPRNVLYYVYIVDRSGTLVGVLNLRELMLAPPQAPLERVMRREPARLRDEAAAATLVAHPGWRQYHALPVVDARGRFVGAIRYETMRRLEQGDRRDGGAPGLVAAESLAELYRMSILALVEGLVAPDREGGERGRGR